MSTNNKDEISKKLAAYKPNAGEFIELVNKFPDLATQALDRHPEIAKDLGFYEVGLLITDKQEPLLIKLINCCVTLTSQILFFTLQYNLLQAAELMIERGAPALETCEKTGDTALHWAVRKDALSIIQKLLEMGLDPDLKNKKGLSGRDLATNSDDPLLIAALSEIHIALLKADGPKVESLLSANPPPECIHLAIAYPTLFTRFIDLGRNPLEFALLAHNESLAETILQPLSEEAQLQEIEKLILQKPHSIAQICDFFFEVDEQHMSVGNLSLVTSTPEEAPIRNLSNLTDRLKAVFKIKEVFTFDQDEYTLEAVAFGLDLFIHRVNAEEVFTATPPKDSHAFKEQYAVVRNMLHHLIIYLEKAEAEKSPYYANDLKDICLHLAAASSKCFTQYRETTIDLYNKYLLKIATTHENAILLELQQLRGIIVEAMVDEPYVDKSESVHAIQHFKRILGERLQLTDRDLYSEQLAFESTGFIEGEIPDESQILHSFFNRYTPSMLFDCIRSALQDSTFRFRHLDWARSNLKSYIPAYATFKANKAAQKKKRSEVLKNLTETNRNHQKQDLLMLAKEQNLFMPKGISPIEALQDEWQGEASGWLVDKETLAAKPFPIVLTLMKQGALRLKIWSDSPKDVTVLN